MLAAALEAEESLEDLEEAAKKENDPKLKELVQKLNETIQEMKLPGVDTKEALAKLSEMQAAITAQQAQFNVGLVDAQMQALGEAMASTQALEGAGKALQQGKYDKAAEQLEKAEPKFDRKEAKTLKDKLAQAAKAMEEAGLAELSTATTELSESMEDAGQCRGRLQEAGQPGPRPGPPQEDQRLACASVPEPRRVQRQLPEEQHGQAAAPQEVGQAQATAWGMATSGNTDGELTKLDSARQKEQVKGEMGEGASETETTHMPEGRQAAARAYREQYQKYRRMTEAALDSEPIPLGHRQTIRRYFELIRPAGRRSRQGRAAGRWRCGRWGRALR